MLSDSKHSWEFVSESAGVDLTVFILSYIYRLFYSTIF